MNNLALYSASQSISNLISDPSQMPKDYLLNEANKLVVNTYEFFNNTSKRDETINEPIWNKSTWYISPSPPIDYSAIKDVNRDIDFCGMTVPFTSEAALNANYTKLSEPGSFIGMADSAVLCAHPIKYFDFYTQSEDNTDYNCLGSDLPITIPNWEEKWYSPVCRDWFKEQKAAPNHGTLSDIYTYTGG